MSIIYPVPRLLAQPKLFNAIAHYLGGPDFETLRSAFYDILEAEFDEVSVDECFFEAEEAYFESQEDGAIIIIQLDTGVTMKLEALKGEVSAQITCDSQLSASYAVNRKLVSAIEDSHPELKNDIVLEPPPTPGNRFLSSRNGESFEGSFHLISDPSQKYAFNVLVVDPDSDTLKASIRPM